MAGNHHSGRKPRPPNIKQLYGTRRDRLNPDAPMPDVGLPKPPHALSPRAATTWDELGPPLVRLGTLTLSDGLAFAELCELKAAAALIAEQKADEAFTPLVLEVTVDGAGQEHVKAREHRTP